MSKGMLDSNANIDSFPLNLQALISWPFLTSLGLLLANDIQLKALFANWLTGKLSDFSGIFLITMFLATLLPSYGRISGLLIATLFTVWKSPLSQPMIEFVQSLGFGHFGRVIDYSDLIALAMIPLAIRCAKKPHVKRIPFSFVRKALAASVVVITLLAIMGTSIVTYDHRYAIQYPDRTISPEEVSTIIESVALAHGLNRVEKTPLKGECIGNGIRLSYETAQQKSNILKGSDKVTCEDQPPTGQPLPAYAYVEYFGNRILLNYAVEPDGSIRINTSGMPDGFIFHDYPKAQMNKLRKSLIREFEARNKDVKVTIIK